MLLTYNRTKTSYGRTHKQYLCKTRITLIIRARSFVYPLIPVHSNPVSGFQEKYCFMELPSTDIPNSVLLLTINKQ